MPRDNGKAPRFAHLRVKSDCSIGENLCSIKQCRIKVLEWAVLTQLRRIIKQVEINHGVSIDLDKISLCDGRTYEMLQRGETEGVYDFYSSESTDFDSSGFTEFLKKLKPDCFEDLIAANCLYRPGPIDAGLVDSYIARKHGKELPEYLHPLMEPILKETYGLILYQEQIVKLLSELAGLTFAEGDFIRRAMGMRKKEVMDRCRQKFIDGARSNIGEEVAIKVYDLLLRFSGYTFNKSHSTCYALVSYQAAYLKCHFPVEYEKEMRISMDRNP